MAAATASELGKGHVTLSVKADRDRRRAVTAMIHAYNGVR